MDKKKNKVSSEASQLIEEEVSSEIEQLRTEIQFLNKRIKRLTSFRWLLLRSIVQGFFYTLGATVLFGLAFYYFDKVLEDFFQSEVLRNVVQVSQEHVTKDSEANSDTE